MLGTLGLVLLAAACGTTRPQMTQEEEMAAWMAYGTPGEHHEAMLDSLGTWATTSTFWEEPGTEPQVTAGTATRTSEFDGLFVVEEFHGTFFGEPFEGKGISGYDNARGVHQSLWIDSMSSGMYTQVGECRDGCDVIEWEGWSTDPLTGEKVPMRMKTTVISPDEQLLEMWGSEHGGPEYKMMEILYTRA